MGRSIRGELTVVRPAADGDVDLLAAWHSDPETSPYWDESFTADQVRARLARVDVDAWVIEAAGEPVGYLQSWWEAGVEPRRGGLDGFLVPAARGRGLMPDAARALAERLLADGWLSVTVDPYAWNERALRGWAKAGFVEVSRNPSDDGHPDEWVLMRFDPETRAT